MCVSVLVSVFVCVCVCVHVHASIWRIRVHVHAREFVGLRGGGRFKRTTACLANISDADITEVCCGVRRGFGRGYARGLRLLHEDALRAVTAWGERLLGRCAPRMGQRIGFRTPMPESKFTRTLCYNCYNYSRELAMILRHGLFAARECGEQTHVVAPVECVGQRTPPGCRIACR